MNMKTYTFNVVTSIIISTALFHINAHAKEGVLEPVEIYRGGLAIEEIHGTIELRDGSAPVINLEATVRNTSEKQERAPIELRSSKKTDLTFRGGSQQSVQLSTDGVLHGIPGGTQQAEIDLTTLIDGKLPDKGISNINIEILLPNNSPGLIRSSKELVRRMRDGKPVYYLTENNRHLGRLNLVYSTGPVTLNMIKAITPVTINKGRVDVHLAIQNLGPEDARNVHLEDNYDPRDFEGEGADFYLYKDEPNDNRLLWRKDISLIRAGETLEVNYSLTAKNPVNNTDLSAAFATINNQLIGVSNKISLGR